MKVLVEFDLTCPRQRSAFDFLRAKLHSDELPEETQQAVKAVSRKLDTETPVTPEVTIVELRTALAELINKNDTYSMELQETFSRMFNIKSISEMTPEQRYLALQHINKIISESEDKLF